MKLLKYFYIFVLGCSLCNGCESAQSGTATETSIKSSSEEQSEQEEAIRQIFAMDTYMTLMIYGERAEEAADAAEAEIKRLDELLSTGSESSEIAKINKEAGGELSEDTAEIVKRALALNKDTDGAFDITIYPVMKVWGFADDNFAVPDEDTLKEKLALVDSSYISFDEDKSYISFGKEGVEIDLGGIAKGYTSDRVVEILKSYGIEHAMINLGGNVDLLGSKTDGSDWRIAVQDPDDEDAYIGILSVSDKSVITSGGYERYFEKDGVRYHHIIDPGTGYPANNGLASVTIVSDDGTLGDGLSTSLFVMGKDKAIEYWKTHSDSFSTILIDEEGKIYISEDIAASFETDSAVNLEILEK